MYIEKNIEGLIPAEVIRHSLSILEHFSVDKVGLL